MANALAAISTGSDRIHATALGLGERTGNTPVEQLLTNLYLLNLRRNDLTALPAYMETVAKGFGVSIPANFPVVGRDAFRTATGVHAAAVTKALESGHRDLADLVYSGVPASCVGREQEIEIGQLSGASNVRYYLRSRNLPDAPEIVQAVLERAKASSRVLREKEIADIVRRLSPDQEQ
jgi:2-isopropylmalate synthase